MSTRFIRLGAVVALAIVIAGAAIAVSASGGRDPSPAAETPATVTGIPEHDGVLGDPGAPVTVTEFVDLQCPVCAAASRELLPTLVNDYVRTGKVKLALRTLHFIGPDSETAARVAAGAQRQGKLWSFVEAFYARQGHENSGYVTESFLREVAKTAGVDADAALADAGSADAQQALDRADADAKKLGIDATPTFSVGRGEGAPHVIDAASLLQALADATAR